MAPYSRAKCTTTLENAVQYTEYCECSDYVQLDMVLLIHNMCTVLIVIRININIT